MSGNELEHIVSSLVYSSIGLVMFALAFFIIVKVAPFSVQKEIEEDQNTSLGIILFVVIGLSIIIAAAIV